MRFGDYKPSPRELRKLATLRERALVRLNASKAKLPRLTKAQATILVEMMVAAYQAGEKETQEEFLTHDLRVAQERSRRGVLARREKSKRIAFVRAWNEAVKDNRDVSVAQVAREQRISRATAYRALNMTKAGVPAW